MGIRHKVALNRFMEHLEVLCTLHQPLVVLQVARRRELICLEDNLVTVELLEVRKKL